MGEISINVNKVIMETLPNAITKALNDACQIIENDAAKKCPVDDGPLRASITHKVSREEDAFVGVIGSNAEYAPYVHEGTGLYAKDGNGRKEVPWRYRAADGKYYTTSGQKPNPFLQNAIDENMDNILKPFEGCLDNDT